MNRASLSSVVGNQTAVSSMWWLLRRGELVFEVGQVLPAPVVGEAVNPQPVEHLGPLLGPPLLAVVRDDAPGDEVRAVEECGMRGGIASWRGSGQGGGRGSEQGENQADGGETDHLDHPL